MAPRVQVVVEAKDAASGVLRAVTSQLGAMGDLVEELTAKKISWGNVAQTATAMVIDGVKDAIKATTEYSEAVRDQALASGQSAEEASRFLQVLDDYQLTADDAKTATRALTKEGLAPTVETLIQLSAEYQNLTTVEEKNAFVQDKLGRAGQEWLNLLDQGPEKIRAMNDAVSQGLILSDADIVKFEEYRLALDEYNDTVEELKITAGGEIMGPLTDGIKTVNQALKDNQVETERAKDRWTNWLSVVNPVVGVWEGTADLIKAHNEVTHEAGTAIERGAAMTEYWQKRLEATNGTLVDSVDRTAELAQVADNLKVALSGDFIETHEKYDEKMGELNEQSAELRAQLEELKRRGVKESSEEFRNLTSKIDETNKAQEELEKSTKKTIAQMIYQQAAANLDAGGQLELARTLGLVSEQDYAIAKAIDSLTDKYDTNKDGVIGASEATQQYIKDIKNLNTNLANLPDVVTVDVITNFVTTGTPSTSTQPLDISTGPCFIENTPVRISDAVTKPIQDIQEGDTVLAFDEITKTHIPVKVGKVFRHTPAEMGSYYLMINNIGVTPSHMVFCNGEWMSASNIRVGDELLGFDGKPVTVSRVRWIYKRVRTYNLHVEHEAHNYYAHDVLVHNGKQQGGVMYAGQPTRVGEAGTEYLFPQQDGRVIGHAEAIHAMTLGGGGGNTNYFYGNVTIASGGENAGDIMEIR